MNDLPLRRAWQAIEDQRCGIMEALRPLPVGQLRKRPTADAWHVADVLQHLQLAENGILRHAIHKQRARASSVTWRARVLYRIMQTHFALPVFKTKAPPKAVPAEDTRTLIQIESDWEQGRKDWLEFLSDLTREELRRGIFYHPITGPLTPLATVRWIAMHIHHHEKQIQRILRVIC